MEQVAAAAEMGRMVITVDKEALQMAAVELAATQEFMAAAAAAQVAAVEGEEAAAAFLQAEEEVMAAAVARAQEQPMAVRVRHLTHTTYSRLAL